MKWFLVGLFFATFWLVVQVPSSFAYCTPSGDGQNCGSWVKFWADNECDVGGTLYCCRSKPQCQEFRISPFRDPIQWQQVACDAPGIFFKEDVTGLCYVTTPSNTMSLQALLNLPGIQLPRGMSQSQAQQLLQQQVPQAGQVIDCGQAADPAACQDCLNQGPTWVWTAIGCLHAGNPVVGGIPGLAGPSLIGQVLGWAVIVGAGIAFVLVVFSGFQIATASGDPKRLQAARELLFSAISGLLLIIFSIFLLNLIGIRVLNLPGFLTPSP